MGRNSFWKAWGKARLEQFVMGVRFLGRPWRLPAWGRAFCASFAEPSGEGELIARKQILAGLGE
jgi:hypothetical protein